MAPGHRARTGKTEGQIGARDCRTVIDLMDDRTRKLTPDIPDADGRHLRISTRQSASRRRVGLRFFAAAVGSFFMFLTAVPAVVTAASVPPSPTTTNGAQ